MNQMMIGEKHGKLTVLEYSHTNKHYKRIWKCICECGNEAYVVSSKLKSGHTKSCGCLKTEHTISLKYSHGESHTRLYKRWIGMRERCSITSDQRKDYYDRGIRVCERWNDYVNFKHDMENGFKPELTLERINNDEGYSPENCCWATRLEQNRNTRKSKKC